MKNDEFSFILELSRTTKDELGLGVLDELWCDDNKNLVDELSALVDNDLINELDIEFDEDLFEEILAL